MNAKIRAKKNKRLSNLKKRVVRVMEKGTPVTPITSVPKVTRIVSPATLVEEITPRPKKQHVANKGKEKADSHSSSMWDNARLAQIRAQDALTTKELKALSSCLPMRSWVVTSTSSSR